MVIGLINPRFVLYWGKTKSRKNMLLFYSSLLIATGIMAVLPDLITTHFFSHPLLVIGPNNTLEDIFVMDIPTYIHYTEQSSLPQPGTLLYTEEQDIFTPIYQVLEIFEDTDTLLLEELATGNPKWLDEVAFTPLYIYHTDANPTY